MVAVFLLILALTHHLDRLGDTRSWQFTLLVVLAVIDLFVYV